MTVIGYLRLQSEDGSGLSPEIKINLFWTPLAGPRQMRHHGARAQGLPDHGISRGTPACRTAARADEQSTYPFLKRSVLSRAE
jgi:hypothetical protein